MKQHAGAMRLSIIIPAYNVEQYIEAALDSVLAQSVLPHEIVVINDGSTDGTEDKIERYDHRELIKVVKTSNQGLGPARNEGARHATGDYLYFFDSDDVMDTRLVECVGQFVGGNAAPDVILFSGEPFDGTHKLPDRHEDYLRGYEMSSGTGEEALVEMVHVNRIMPTAYMYVVRRTFWEYSGFRFQRIIHEDEALFPELLLTAKSVVVTNRVLVYRRIRPKSITQMPVTVEHMSGYLSISNAYAELYRGAEEYDFTIRKYLRKHAKWRGLCYLRVAIQLNEAVDVKSIFNVSGIIKSTRLLRCLFFYYKYVFYGKLKALL